jgi:hypothetical protein
VIAVDQLVHLEGVDLAGVELFEPLADVLEELTKLLVVVGGDQLPPSPPGRLVVVGSDVVPEIGVGRVRPLLGLGAHDVIVEPLPVGRTFGADVRTRSSVRAVSAEPSIGIDPRWPMAKSDAAPDG